MGLSIHFELRLPGSTSEDEINRVLRKIREKADSLALDFVGPLNFGDATIGGQDFLRLVASIMAEPKEEDIPPMIGDVETARAVLVCVGEECEPAHFGFLRRSDEAGTEHDWFWWCSCKTQYASNVSDEHFVACHTALVTLLDHAISLGIQVKVWDEGNYWDTRDAEVLLQELHKMNGLMAAFAGKLADMLGPERSVEASIFEHPRFEHLEMEGQESEGGG